MKNRRNPKPQSRRLFVESLERREVLAGNVTATLTGGLLRVTGDTLNNQVVIWQNEATGTFNVTGQTSGTATKVNNGPNNNTVTFTGPVTSILVDLKQGNDTVFIGAGTSAFAVSLASFAFVPNPAVVPSSITVYGGNGNDRIYVSANGGDDPITGLPRPTTAIAIDGGNQTGTAQNDTVSVANTFAGAVAINNYGGNDNIFVTTSVIPTLAINAGVATGTNDNDNVTLTAVASFNTAVNMGTAGTTDATDNTLTISNSIFGNLAANGGAGRDRVFLTNVLLLNGAFNLLGGNDYVAATNVQAGFAAENFQDLAAAIGPLPFGYDQLIANYPGIPGNLAINTGEGSDDVRLNNVVVASSLAVFLGGGNDFFRSTNVTSNLATIDGGLGTDRRSAVGIVADVLKLLSFEGPNNL